MHKVLAAFGVIALLGALLGGCSRDARVSALDTVGCGLVAADAHPDPEVLLDEFVRRDAAGEFVASSAWFDQAVSCPGHESAPDEAIMARSPQMRILERASDSVVAEVRWERLGYYGATAHAEAPGIDHDTLTAVRTPHGWRVRSPALRPHMPVPPPPEADASASRPAA